MTYNYKKEINQWLKDISEETASKIWKVAIVLNSRREILGQDKFIVPYESIMHDSLKYEGLDRDTMQDILGMMHQKGIVTFWGKIDTRDSSNKVPDQIIETPFDYEGVYFGPDTEVQITKDIFQHMFSVLALKRRRAVSSENDTKKYCWLDNETFFIRLKDGSLKSMPFGTRRETKFMLLFFKILYQHWQQFGNKPLEREEIRKRLLKGGLPEASDKFIKDTASNLRKSRINPLGLSELISITYDRSAGGFSLDIKKPS